MASSTDSKLQAAFSRDISIQNRAREFSSRSSDHAKFIEDITDYILTVLQQLPPDNVNAEPGESQNKKRKLDHDSESALSAFKPRFEVRDVSFSIPQRKKLHLELSEDRILLRNPSNTQTEASELLKDYAYAVRLPVPEKAQKQYNYCLIPAYGEGIGRQQPGDGKIANTILWTVNFGPPKAAKALDSAWSKELASSGDEILDDALNIALKKAANIQLTYPDEDEFASAKPESHRKGETAFHVKAFKGSKEGYLFLLSTGLFFGYKKPLLFFPFDYIHSVSYTSVLQRTFNLVISVTLEPDSQTQNGTAAEEASATEDFEFSMIDQADFAGIDAYIKRHELNDASMAANRRAKKVNVNKPRAAANGAAGSENGAAAAVGTAPDGDDEDGEETELQKAQRQLEEEEIDEEDEMEEDYDPGSSGESEGSGSDSEDDNGDEQYDNAKQRKSLKGGKDLVQEELGSEAEDVSVTEDEEEVEEDEEEEDEEEEEEEEAAAVKPHSKAVPAQRNIASHQRQQAPPPPLLQEEMEPDPFDDDQL